MLEYIVKRLLAGLATVFFLATATFVAMHAARSEESLFLARHPWASAHTTQV